VIFRRKKKTSLLMPSFEAFDSMLGPGSEIHGRVVANKSIRIDGTVHGNVETPVGLQNITIALGESARVYGDISAFRVLIGGYVEGNVYATERVELHSKAIVNGDVSYAELGIEPGAEIVGLMVKKAPKKSPIELSNHPKKS
jgi:cytoskeletal protein CcmA (bactofilin family)